MKATVAYEAPRRQKQAIRMLKWHLGKNCLEAKGVKGTYSISAQKPNRRLGVFKWCLWLDGKPVDVNGKPTSMDDRSELKAFASSFDAIPSGTVIAVSEEAPAAKEAPCTTCGHAKESPTREEWEVIVTNPPAAHRGAILAMGLGETSEVGNKIILRGFHDDEQAGRVASSIARTYKVGVTFGPRNALYEAAEGKAGETPRAPPAFDEHAATELELYADNTSELYNQKLAVIANLKKRLARGTYQPELAAKLWLYWVDAAAKRYAREFADGREWNVIFPIEVRREVSRRLEKRERYEMESLGLPARPAYAGDNPLV